MIRQEESSLERLCEGLTREIARSGLRPEILTPEWLPKSRFVKTFEGVLCQAFRTLGFDVLKEVENPFILAWQREHPGVRIGHQRADYILMRERRVVAIVELESLDRAQMMTFKCQYYDWDNGKRDYYWTTVDHLVRHPEISPPTMFVFILALPDFSVSPYQVWDTSDPYYDVSRADCSEIFRSPYGFYDHRIKALLREMLLNQDPESTSTLDWSIQGRRLADYQDICELVIITITGPEVVLARGRDLFATDREVRCPLTWREKST